MKGNFSRSGAIGHVVRQSVVVLVISWVAAVSFLRGQGPEPVSGPGPSENASLMLKDTARYLKWFQPKSVTRENTDLKVTILPLEECGRLPVSVELLCDADACKSMQVGDATGGGGCGVDYLRAHESNRPSTTPKPSAMPVDL